MWNPINRTTVQVEENKYRTFHPAGPLFYKKSDGTFGEIDLTFNDTSSSIGDISLMDKGVVSVGKRKGNNPTKVVGIRPDKNQHLGTQQLEFSLINVELDGQSQSFNVETDLEIKLRASKVQQLVKLDKSFSDCKIEFDIHTTGIELQNEKYSETTTIRDYGFNLKNIGEIEGGNTDLTINNYYSSASKDIPYLDCYACKITDEYITTGEYSIEEEFGSDDLSDYTLKEMYGGGGSVYNKDNIIFMVKPHNIENHADIVINQLCDIYGLEYFDDGGNGQYLTKNNKKVAGLHYNSGIFYVFINTIAIPDKIKTLFKRKTFNDTSYLDITLSDFCTSITSRLNKDLKIEVDNTYYKHDIFEFKLNNKSFYITPPIAFDKDYNELAYVTTHTLKDNGDGTYRYTKYLMPENALKVNTAQYLDATVSPAHTQDTDVEYKFGHSTGIKWTSTNWNTARNDTSGTNNFHVELSDTTAGRAMVGEMRRNQLNLNTGTNYTWQLWQWYAYFDTSGITDTVTSAKLRLWCSYYQVSNNTLFPDDADMIKVIVLKSDMDTIASGTTSGTTYTNWRKSLWNDFVGMTSGWDSSDVTEYSSAYDVDGAETGVLADMVEEEIPLNSDALSDLQSLDTFKLTLIENSDYYADVFDSTWYPGSNGYAYHQLRMGNIDHATTSYRPYIEYETGAASGYGHKVVGVAAASIGKVSGVATANVGKVIGVD